MNSLTDGGFECVKRAQGKQGERSGLVCTEERKSGECLRGEAGKITMVAVFTGMSRHADSWCRKSTVSSTNKHLVSGDVCDV